MNTVLRIISLMVIWFSFAILHCLPDTQEKDVNPPGNAAIAFYACGLFCMGVLAFKDLDNPKGGSK